jgi:7-cyano-7-deazaguanine synthase
MKAVLLLSGGMDSATMLYLAKSYGWDITALSVYYGQRHSKELDYARQLANQVGVHHEVLDLLKLQKLLRGSALTSDIDVPEGHYAAENMKLTVVPNRNMILLAIAGGYAVSLQANRVGAAMHAGDHAIYPDCRPDFVRSFEETILLGTEGFAPNDFHLWTPFIDISKTDIVKQGHELNVPWQLTWSCYKGGDYHCGKCGTCVERREAFQLAGVFDPTKYEVDL